MEIQVQIKEEVSIVAVSGSIDALTSGEVAESLSKEATSGQVKLVLDLGAVDFMSSAGLRAILGALKEARSLGGDLRIAAAPPGVEKVLNISGFTSILKTYPAVEAAVESYSG